MEGGLLNWGDSEAALALVREIAEGTENGKMIGNGCHFTGKKLEYPESLQLNGNV